MIRESIKYLTSARYLVHCLLGASTTSTSFSGQATSYIIIIIVTTIIVTMIHTLIICLVKISDPP